MHLKTDYHVLVLDTYILTSHFLILAELIFFCLNYKPSSKILCYFRVVPHLCFTSYFILEVSSLSHVYVHLMCTFQGRFGTLHLICALIILPSFSASAV